MPWGPNLVGELPLPCVGWDRACCFFPNMILAGLEGREIEVPYEEHRALWRGEELLWPRGGWQQSWGADPPRVVGTGSRKDALLGAGCSPAASRSCTAWRHRDHHCLCRIPYWIAERGNTIHRLACEPGRNELFKTAFFFSALVSQLFQGG